MSTKARATRTATSPSRPGCWSICASTGAVTDPCTGCDPHQVFRRPFRLSHAANAVCSRWRWYAASACADGQFPMGSRNRRWLNQWPHLRGCEFHRLDASPRASRSKHLRLVQPDDAHGQALGVADGAILRPAVAMMGQGVARATARSYSAWSSASNSRPVRSEFDTRQPTGVPTSAGFTGTTTRNYAGSPVRTTLHPTPFGTPAMMVLRVGTGSTVLPYQSSPIIPS